MKRVFSLIFVFLLISAVVSCGGKKKEEKPAYEEQVTKEISASDGGKVESKDGKTSIEIPADALDENLTITMTIYDAKGYTGTEGQKVVSKVVEFEPSGTVFKKPVIITMAATEDVKDKVFSAAVYREEKGEWSYNEHGAYGVLAGRDAAGDPIMQSAAGDPIMLSAAGDPIMQSTGEGMAAAGDPIMLASAGDPIMSNAAGDPIMNAAAGDPIMMTTGHFTAYTFITLESAGPVEEPDEEVPESDEEITDEDDDEPEITDEEDRDNEISEDDEEITDEDEDEIPVVDEDEDIDTTPAEPPVYSKVLCTGLTRCSDGGMIIDCPAEGEEFYGQDAQFVAGKTCVLHKYSIQSEPVAVEEDDPEEGEETGLRNILHGNSNNKNVKRGLVRSGETGESYEFVLDENTGLKWVVLSGDVSHSDAEDRCARLTYGGHEWRLPTVKEFLSISDHDRFASATNEYYFRNWGNWSYWTAETDKSSGSENDFWVYNSDFASLMTETSTPSGGSLNGLACVSGEVYGNPGEYEVRNIGGKEVVFDPSTNLIWQKDSKQVETWKDALAYCKNLEYAGYSDWRLPNKNELVTLVDYSKAEPASSFPGMTSETLFSSTSQVSYGNAGGPITVNMQSGRVGEYDSYYFGEDLAVRCVRSDSQPLPAGRTIPYCDESRIGPCEDAATGYVWSSADIDSNYDKPASWLDKAVQCRESNEGGISKWRIPTIDEVRTLLPSNENLKTGGECKVTNECFDYASADCFNESVCSEEGGEMIISSLFDYSGYLTGTVADAENTDYSWFVNMRTGSLERIFNGNDLFHESRCIKDESLPDPVAFPYTDSENGLIWSSLSKSYLYNWYDVSKYCKELVEGASNNWRVPSIDELKTLVKNCPEGNCPMNLSGEYSVFGDIGTLWSSDISSSDTESDSVHLLKFMTASVESQSIYDYNSVKVRCVRGTDESETEPEIEFPFEIGDLIWSKVSNREYYSVSDATGYCNSLNEEGYDGRTDWTLPTIENIVSLIKKSVCTNKNDLFAGNGSCNQYSFDGYSVFDDMVRLMGSNGYVDFAEGWVSHTDYPSGYARCVIVLPDSGS